MLTFIKEYCVTDNGTRHLVIRSKFYDNSLEYFLQLFEEAKKDFPTLDLQPKDIEAEEYDGDTHRGQRGIEFSAPKDVEISIPKEYKLWNDLSHIPRK